MPRKCSICMNPKRTDIDKALVFGESYRNVSNSYAISLSAVQRHIKHIPAELARAKEAAQISQAAGLLEQVVNLQIRAMAILNKAEESGSLGVALSAIREARSTIELLAKLTGELRERDEITVNVLNAPEWVKVRSTLLVALRSYPDAAIAVAQALEGYDRR